MKNMLIIITLVLLTALSVAAQDGTGLRGDYYNSTSMIDRTATRIDPTIDFQYTDKGPMPGIPVSYFSVRWMGTVLPQYSEKYTFYTSSDDGIRLWVDNKLLVDQWRDRSSGEDVATIDLQAGKAVNIRVDYYQGGGMGSVKLMWSSPSLPKEVVPQKRLFPAQESRAAVGQMKGTGLKGEYYANQDLTDLRLTRVDPRLNISFDGPVSDTVDQLFSARWTGFVMPLYSEKYTFSVTSDDGVRLWVDGKLLVDDWTAHGPTEFTGSIELLAGNTYDIRIEYFNSGGAGMINLAWSSERNPRETIPTANLYPIAYFPGKIFYNESDNLNYTAIVSFTADSEAKKLSPLKTGEASVSADGKKVVYVNAVKAKLNDPLVLADTDIAVMDADGSNAKTIVRKNKMDRHPSFSPDGTRIVFSSTSGDHPNLYTMNLDGSDATRLTNGVYDDDYPVYTPDGTKIIFQSKRDGQTDIYSINGDGSGLARLTTAGGSMPAVSPDGKQIAFVSSRDGKPDIYLMNADGSGQSRLTALTGDKGRPTFSPLTPQCAFSIADAKGRSDIYLISFDGLGLRRLTDNGKCFDPVWVK